jgi:hypothetical protein
MIHRAAITVSFFTAACFCLFALMTAFSCISTEQICEGNWEASDGTPKEWTPDIETAQVELIRWSPGDENMPTVAWVSGWTCCDCGLVHRMAFIPIQDGLLIYIWSLDQETRKERMRRGWYRDLYGGGISAESGRVER